MKSKRLARAIIEEILSGEIEDRETLHSEKIKLSKQLSLSGVPSSIFILSHASPGEREKVIPLLLRKPTRTASGVAIVAAQTSPSQTCPGHCIYCPDFPQASKSYTGHEPASMRAVQCGFDPYLQVACRLGQLASMGHSTSKVELIIQGGTFPAMDLEYRRWFIARCLDAMVDHGGQPGGPRSLERGIKASEKAPARPVGITCETRPDWCTDDHVRGLVEMGATRVEIGVQSLSDRVYALVGRGHRVIDVEQAFRAARKGGLKICAHMMMGLPGSDEATDLESFRTLFEDPRFRPDELKVYPTLVIEGTKLHQMWREGAYEPLSDDQVLARLLKMKEVVPPWVRIKRVMRDIPAKMVSAGPRRSDMRGRVLSVLESQGKRCPCIRCREVSRSAVARPKFSPHERSYQVTGGEEVFLSFEDPVCEVLGAFLRLSLASGGACRVREIHTYGRVVGVGSKPSGSEWQHRGMGRSLMGMAEERTREYGGSYLYVTSGIGARDYYRKLGYGMRGPYMVKKL